MNLPPQVFGGRRARSSYVLWSYIDGPQGICCGRCPVQNRAEKGQGEILVSGHSNQAVPSGGSAAAAVITRAGATSAEALARIVLLL